MIVALLLCWSQERALPAAHTVTDSVSAMVVCDQGVAIATRGGLLTYDGKSVVKHTTLAGLPSNEVIGFAEGKAVVAKTTAGDYEFPYWDRVPTPNQFDFEVGGPLRWRGQAIHEGLQVNDFTAAAHWKDQILVGTARHGVWIRRGKRWYRLESPESEPVGHNIQSLVAKGGSIYAGDIDRGLSRFDTENRRWEPVTTSSLAVKELAIQGDQLLARLGSGRIDLVGTREPKKFDLDHASAIGSDGKTVLAGFRGGFVRIAPSGEREVFRPEALRDVSVTALCEFGRGRIAIGTQTHGLLIYDPSRTPQWEWFDQGLKLGDDWITVVKAMPEGGLLVGTFVGGCWDVRWPVKYHSVPIPKAHITSCIPLGKGVLIGSRAGLHWYQDGRTIALNLKGVGTEVQALAATDHTVWVGTRTGVYEFPRSHEFTFARERP